MPRPRQRIVFCDCLDCVEQPATTDVVACTSPANEAAARQEPPPKCLLFVLSGVLLPRSDPQSPASATVLDACNVPHLNRAAAQGNLCLLTLRQDSTADSCTELSQLLDMYQEHQQGHPPMTLAKRFKGLVGSFSSNSSAAQELAASVGLSHSSVLDHNPEQQQADPGAGSLDPQLIAVGRSKHTAAGAGGATGVSAGSVAAAINHQLPDPAEAARRILQELGLQQADAGLDLLAVHLDLASAVLVQQQQQQQHSDSQRADAGSYAAATTAAVALLGWLDRTLRYLNNSSAFKDAVLLTVLATPGSSQQPAAIPMLAAAGGTALEKEALPQQNAQEVLVQQQQQLQPVPRVCKPLQSCEQLAGQQLPISHQRAILCLRRLPGVIRRDECTKFSLADCCSNSSTLALLADRLLPEVAYKLGRAPKYGA